MEMVPQQCFGYGNSLRDRCKRSDVIVSCKRCGVIPDTGFPRVSVKEMSDNTDMVQTKGASHTTQAFVHGSSSRRYTFEACAIGGVQVRCSVGEVDVLGTFGSGSRGT